MLDAWRAFGRLRRRRRSPDTPLMAEYITRRSASSPVLLFMRSRLFVAQMVAVGFIAIGVSGVCCGAIRYRYGDHTLAFDQETAYLSELRCADLLDAEKAMCAAARLAHHADEIVEVRLAGGVVGLLALAAYFVARSRLGLEDNEWLVQRRRFLWLATLSFGLAATILLSVGATHQLRSGDAAGHLFIDGGVSLAFFLVSTSMLARTDKR
jgi:hypothetical protein